jgi:ankyrin repeat protein
VAWHSERRRVSFPSDDRCRGRRAVKRPAWLASLLCVAAVTGLTAAGTDVRLADAVQARDANAARALLQQHVEVNAPQRDGTTALHWATHWDDLDLVDLLLRAGANPNVVNDLGVPPLSLACTNGSAKVVARLLAGGADPDGALRTGESALMTAARGGSIEIVRLLLARHANVNVAERVRGQTALMWAAAESQPDIVELLIRSGADVHARSSRGSTPLLFAARGGDLASARALVAGGADVNEAEPVIPLPPGADANETLPTGNSALMLASASMNATSGFEYALTVKPSGHEAVALFLLEKGADLKKADTIGATPLHAAVQTNRPALVKALLAHGADPNARLTKAPPPLRGDFQAYTQYVGATPLWYAANARYPDLDIVRALIAAGADTRAVVQDGTTALMAAVGMAQNDARRASEAAALDVIKLLVANGVSVNAVNRSGQTALHGAARAGQNTIVAFLAEHGAALDIKDRQGRTALDVARDPIRPLESTAALLQSLLGRSP